MKNKKSVLLWFDRTLSQGFWSQMGMLFGLMIAAFLLSHLLLLFSWSDWSAYCDRKQVSRLVAPLYLLIDGNAFTSVYENHASNVTVFIACIIYVGGILLFTGMIVSVITNIIERRVEKHRSGLVHYLQSGHYVIMGYDDTIASFISHIFQKQPDADILVLTARKPEVVREKLLNTFSEHKLKQVIINYGHRTSKDEFSAIKLESAKEIFIVGYRGDAAHDAINIECLDAVCEYLSQPTITNRPKRITCVFRDLETYSAFKTTDIFSAPRKLGIEFVPYNYNAGWARQVLVYRSYEEKPGEGTGLVYNYPSVYGPGITENDGHFVHLVFVGTTNAAVAIAAEAAQMLHFPNFEKDHTKKTLITFFEKNADIEKEEFITANRHLFEIQPYLYQDLTSSTVPKSDIQYVRKMKERVIKVPGMVTGFLDVQFQFIRGDIMSEKAQWLLSEWATDTEHQYLSIFLTQSNQRTNFVMGMNMPDAVYDNNIPIFLLQKRSDNLVTNLREESLKAGEKLYYTWDGIELQKSKRFLRLSNIYPIGMGETVYRGNDTHLRRAKLINYLYSTANYDTNKFTSMLELAAMQKDDIWAKAELLWNELTIDIKWSNLYNAYTIETKCASLRAMRGLPASDTSRDTWSLSENEVECLAKVEHNRWNVEKLLMGFRKPLPQEDKYLVAEDKTAKKSLGENKELKIHQDIRPFDELPDNVKELDLEFSRYIPWILEMVPDASS